MFSQTSCQAFEGAAAIAQAYQIGRLESQAALNLLHNVSPVVRDSLKELVRPERPWFYSPTDRLFGMTKFLNHDGVAHGVFNQNYCSGAGSWERWLHNSAELLDLLLERMRKDWESMAMKMRKPWSQKDLESLANSWQIIKLSSHGPAI